MAEPTGLYGWIRSNDGRSTGLFLAFLLAIQVIAPLALVGPLLFIDSDHAPFIGWGGYLVRYAPLVLVVSVIWFTSQLWWHVETVKKAVGFHFVDADDEPRLCAVIEPLIILTGLPVPFVGIIEREGRNAFACGVGRKKAVIVVTRGLLDALSDAELGAVLAHELSHIKHGDIRLMAAANIFMRALIGLNKRNALRFSPVHGLLAIAVPAVLPLSLAGSLLGRLGLRAGQVSRLLISSSREFIADAQAAQWTQDPGALAAALLKVDGRHRVRGARDEDDAMMIAGASEGPGATHPTIAQRVAALARVTGSMVFNAPNAPHDDDWTAATPRSAVVQAGFGRRGLAGTGATEAIARVRQGDRQNWLGLSRLDTGALVVTIGALIGIHGHQLGDVRAMATIFDPRPLGDVIGTAGACQLSPFTYTLKLRCDAGTRRRSLRAFEGQEGTVGGWLADIGRKRREQGVKGDGTLIDSLAGNPVQPTYETYRGQSGRLTPIRVRRGDDGLYRDSDGRATIALPKRLIIAEIDQVGCFVRDAKSMEATGPLPMGSDQVTQDNIARIRSDIARVANETSASTDWAGIAYYLDRREVQMDQAYMYYGQPGLAMARATFNGLKERAALDHVRAVAAAIVIPADVDAIERAKLRALLRDPDAFVPCRSLRSAQ